MEREGTRSCEGEFVCEMGGDSTSMGACDILQSCVGYQSWTHER